MTCEYTRISLLFHILWKINTFTFEHICTFFPNVFSFNFSLHYCLVACIILYTNGQNYYPFFSQCKVTRNIITWAHCMFSADQVAQLSSVPDYFQYPKLRLSDDCPHCCKILQIRLFSCLMCSQLDIGFNQSKWLEKYHFLS